MSHFSYHVYAAIANSKFVLFHQNLVFIAI